MALRVVDSLCRIEGGKLVVVVEGANPEEVTGNEAKKMAIDRATQGGYTRLGFNGQSGSYPVDNEGNTPDPNDLDAYTEFARAGKTAGYRNEILLMGGL